MSAWRADPPNSLQPEAIEREGRWRLVYCILLLAAVALPWIPSHLPTQDGPQHLRLNDFLIEMRTHPGSPLHAVYVDALRFRTASLFSWFCLILHPLLSIEAIERLFVSLCVAGFGWVGWLLTRAARPEAPGRALMLAPFFINWFTTMGFMSYLASIPCAAGACYLLFAPSQNARACIHRAGRVLLAALLLLLACLGHISTVLVALVLAVLLSAARKSRGLMFAVGLAFLPALLLGFASLGGLDAPVSAQQTPRLETPFFNGIVVGIGQLFACIPAGVGPIDMALQGVMLALAVALLGWGIAQIVRLRHPPAGEDQPAVLSMTLSRAAWPLGFIAILVLGVLVLPTEFLGWGFMSARLIPFILLLLPAAVAWPRAGSQAETRLCAALAVVSLFVTCSIGYGWRAVGRDLDNVAGAARVMQPGTRVLPLTFAPGDESPWAVRGAGRRLHAWAIPARLGRLMVPFGFENMRRIMLYGRADASPPLPEGPDEFIGPILWTPGFLQTPRVFAEARLDVSEITDAARFLAPGLRDRAFLDHLRAAVLDQAALGFHYLLLIHPPGSLLGEVRARAWPCLYAQQGTYVYRLGLPLDRFAIQGLTQ